MRRRMKGLGEVAGTKDIPEQGGRCSSAYGHMHRLLLSLHVICRIPQWLANREVEADSLSFRRFVPIMTPTGDRREKQEWVTASI